MQGMVTSSAVRQARAAGSRRSGAAGPVTLYQIVLILVIAAGCALIAYARIVGG